MDITESIKVEKKNIDKLLELECVDRIIYQSGCQFEIVLKAEYSKGRLRVMSGDWLVKFGNGTWQRVGSNAYQNLIFKPRTIWRE